MLINFCKGVYLHYSYLHVEDGHLRRSFCLFLRGIRGKLHDEISHPGLLATQCQ